jgi:hypothetical protein
MSALNFPASPIVGQTYATAGGIIYIWDGVSWVSQGGGYLTTADIASSAQWMAAYTGKILGTDATWGGAAPVTIAFASTITPDMSLFINAELAVTGNFTLANPINTKNGQTGMVAIAQDATGSRLITWGSNWKFQSGVAPVLSTAANAVDLLFYEVRTSSFIYAAVIKAVH